MHASTAMVGREGGAWEGVGGRTWGGGGARRGQRCVWVGGRSACAERGRGGGGDDREGEGAGEREGGACAGLRGHGVARGGLGAGRGVGAVSLASPRALMCSETSCCAFSFGIALASAHAAFFLPRARGASRDPLGPASTVTSTRAALPTPTCPRARLGPRKRFSGWKGVSAACRASASGGCCEWTRRREELPRLALLPPEISLTKEMQRPSRP